MNGVIIIPKFYETHRDRWVPEATATSVFAPLFYGIKHKYGFDMKFADEVDVPANTDVVIMFAVPLHNRPNLMPGLVGLNKKTKLIMFTGDLQCYENQLCLDNKVKTFERCDSILSFTHEYFVKMYPQFLSKYEFFPHFFSPYNRYAQLPFNQTPKNKCLLCGSIYHPVYPLRSFIVDNRYRANIDYRPPVYARDDYARLLHSYLCCVSTSSVFNYALAKCFEIMATGSLLLVNETEDFKKIGLIPYKHYLPINKINVFNEINYCIQDPQNYDIIRKAGMTFTRKNHSIINRMEQFEKILNKLFD